MIDSEIQLSLTLGLPLDLNEAVYWSWILGQPQTVRHLYPFRFRRRGAHRRIVALRRRLRLGDYRLNAEWDDRGYIFVGVGHPGYALPKFCLTLPK